MGTKTVKYSFVLACCLLAFSAYSASENNLGTLIFRLIYNGRYEQAKAMLQKNRDAFSATEYMLLNLDLHWWKYSISRSRNDAGNLKNTLDTFDQAIESQPDNLKLLILLSYRLRFEVKRYNLFEAVKLRSEIRNLLASIEQNEKPAVGLPGKLFGLYQALFEYSEQTENFIFFHISSEAGEKALAEIRACTFDDNLIVQTLAHYFLGRIYWKIERKYDLAKEQFRILSANYPENGYFKEVVSEL